MRLRATAVGGKASFQYTVAMAFQIVCGHKVADGPKSSPWVGPPPPSEKAAFDDNSLKSKSWVWKALGSTVHVNKLPSC